MCTQIILKCYFVYCPWRQLYILRYHKAPVDLFLQPVLRNDETVDRYFFFFKYLAVVWKETKLNRKRKVTITESDFKWLRMKLVQKYLYIIMIIDSM